MTRKKSSISDALNAWQILDAASRLPEMGNSFYARAKAIEDEELRIEAAQKANLDSARQLWRDIEASGEWTAAERFEAIYRRKPDAA